MGWDLTKNEIAIEDTKRLGQHQQVIKIGKTESSVQVRSILVGEYGNIYQVSEFHPIDLGYAYLAYYLSSLIPVEEIIEVVVEGMKDLEKGMQLWMKTFENNFFKEKNSKQAKFLFNEIEIDTMEDKNDEDDFIEKKPDNINTTEDRFSEINNIEDKMDDTKTVEKKNSQKIILPLKTESTYFDTLIDAYHLVKNPHKYTDLGETRTEAYYNAIGKIMTGDY